MNKEQNVSVLQQKLQGSNTSYFFPVVMSWGQHRTITLEMKHLLFHNTSTVMPKEVKRSLKQSFVIIFNKDFQRRSFDPRLSLAQTIFMEPLQDALFERFKRQTPLQL